MEGPVFSEDGLAFLRGCVFDPTAGYGYELLSGAVFWSDEQVLEFLALSRCRGRGYAGHLFAYRTSLLVGRPCEELRFAWDAAWAGCPDWIGFRPERTTPAAHWPAFVEAELDSY